MDHRRRMGLQNPYGKIMAPAKQSKKNGFDAFFTISLQRNNATTTDLYLMMIKRSSHHKIRRFGAPHPCPSCPPPRPNGSLCSSNTEVCQFVRFGNLALSWMTLASLSWMLFKIAYRFGRRSAAKGVDQVEGSCFVEESKKKSKTQNESLSDTVKTTAICA